MEQVLPYFKQAEKLLVANEFESNEDFEVFLQNVFSELDGMEKRMSCHHDGSQMLEKFIQHASSFQLRIFYERISGEMVKLVVHRYASHVMEALLKRSQECLAQGGFIEDKEDKEKALASLTEMVVRLSNEIGEAFDEVVCSAWGSHVYRQLLSLLQAASITAELELIFENVSLSQTAFLRDLAFNQSGSPALQAIIKAAFEAKSPFCKTILEKIFSDDDGAEKFVLRAASNECASHLVEAAVKAFDSAAFLSFYTKCVRPSFGKILSGTPSNFLLQHLISACHNSAQLAILMDDLQPHLETLISSQRAGLLVRLVGWAGQAKAFADAVLAAVFTAFHAKSDRKHIFERVLHLQVEDDAYASKISNLGCSLLVGIAGLPEAASGIKPFVDNILELPLETLERVALHSNASRVLEAFIMNGCLSERALSRLIRTLKGRFPALASDRFASHLVERLWSTAKAELKTQIMAELALARQRLDATPHGRLVLRKCRIGEFEAKQEDWVKAEEASERKRNMFADIIEDQPKAKKTKKRKKTAEESLLL